MGTRPQRHPRQSQNPRKRASQQDSEEEEEEEDDQSVSLKVTPHQHLRSTKRGSRHKSTSSNNKTNDNCETFYGYIQNPVDALYVIEGTIRGVLNSFAKSGTTDMQGVLIRSGTVIVLPEIESGCSSVKRWRDGYRWSASRVYGPFLIYRQVGYENVTKGVSAAGTPESQGAPLSNDLKPQAIDSSGQKKLKSQTSVLSDGLTKRTISLKGSDGLKYRVICYYTSADVAALAIRQHPRTARLAASASSQLQGEDEEVFQTPTSAPSLQFISEEVGGKSGIAALLAESLTSEMLEWHESVDGGRSGRRNSWCDGDDNGSALIADAIASFVPRPLGELYAQYLDPTMPYPYKPGDLSPRSQPMQKPSYRSIYQPSYAPESQAGMVGYPSGNYPPQHIPPQFYQSRPDHHYQYPYESGYSHHPTG
ncbi:Gti1/Pac2 family-domain-containing protein [Obelidium mucronatum]|nr:Gti1/Pac2 family-domain-containing protein [Obelidium mucronatum]